MTTKPDFFTLLSAVECSRDDKKCLIPVIAWFEQLCRIGRSDGLLALEDELDTAPSDFARDLTRLLVDGRDQETIDQYAFARIYSRRLDGVELLSAMVTLAGIRSLLDGDSLPLLRMRLLAYLGSDRDLYGEIIQARGNEVCKEEVADESFVVGDKPEKVLATVLKRKPLSQEQRISCGKLLSVEQLLGELEPRQLAMLILAANEKDRAEVAARLSFDKLYEVLEEVNAFENFEPEVVIASCRHALESLISMMETHSWPTGGRVGMRSILSGLPVKEGLDFMDYLESTMKTDTFGNIKMTDAGFISTLRETCQETFFDLEKILLALSNRDMQTLLRELDRIELIRYLRYSKAELQEKVISNLSSVGAATFKEDLQELSDGTLAQASQARRYITDIIERLAKANTIKIPGLAESFPG